MNETDNLVVKLSEAYGEIEKQNTKLSEQSQKVDVARDAVANLEREVCKNIDAYLKNNFELVNYVKCIPFGGFNLRFFYEREKQVGVKSAGVWEGQSLMEVFTLWQGVTEKTFKDYAKNTRRCGTIMDSSFKYCIISIIGAPLALLLIPSWYYYARKNNKFESDNQSHYLSGKEACFYLLEKYEIRNQRIYPGLQTEREIK